MWFPFHRNHIMDTKPSIKPTQRIRGVPAAPLLYMAKHLSPRDDIRYYLNSVYIDPKGHLVVTNDKFMVVVDFDPPAGMVEGDIGIIVKVKDILELAKNDAFPAKPSLHRSSWTLDIEESWQSDEAGTLAFRWDSQADDDAPFWTTKAAEGRYPDWRQVMPAPVKGHTGMPSQVNPEYVYAIDKFYRELKNSKRTDFVTFELLHTGTMSCAQVRPLVPLDWESRGIIMPYRGNVASNIDSPALKTVAERIEYLDRAMDRARSIKTNIGLLNHGADELKLEFTKRYIADLTNEIDTALSDLKADLASEAIASQTQPETREAA